MFFELGIQLRWTAKQITTVSSGCSSCGSKKQTVQIEYQVNNIVPCQQADLWYWKQLPEDSGEGFTFWLKGRGTDSIVELPEEMNNGKFVEGRWIDEVRGRDVENVIPETERPKNQIKWFTYGRIN
jgi:hypothetical protein